MKALIVCAAFLSAIGVSVWMTYAQVAAAPRHLVWEYATYHEQPAINEADFDTSGPRIRGNGLAAIYTALTGQQPIKHIAGQAADCTYLDIMNAAGAQGWELVSETRDGPKTMVFKRFTQ